MQIVAARGFDHAVVAYGYELVSPRDGAAGKAAYGRYGGDHTITLARAIPDGNWLTLGAWVRRTTGAGRAMMLAGHDVVITTTSLTIGPASANTTGFSDTGWHQLQIAFKRGGAGVGRIKAWIDGVQVMDFTGESKPGAFVIPSFTLSTSVGSEFFWDDVWADDTNTEPMSAVANVVVSTIAPTAAGESTAWTPSSGDNWAALADAVDTSKVTAQTPGTRDLYQFGDLPGGIGTVEAVQVCARGQRLGTAAPVLRCVAKSGAAVAAGAGEPLPATLGNMQPSIFAVDPATGSPWTPAAVDSAQFGMELA